ncbi:unnamed protein product, partial [Mesorhabditis belari]|uniref:CCHC-type domain-containing protein n=1 Tax=Mesorhabditis belari TaxID=2138241 RepID=A0AAF3FE30_9BILA
MSAVDLDQKPKFDSESTSKKLKKKNVKTKPELPKAENKTKVKSISNGLSDKSKMKTKKKKKLAKPALEMDQVPGTKHKVKAEADASSKETKPKRVKKRKLDAKSEVKEKQPEEDSFIMINKKPRLLEKAVKSEKADVKPKKKQLQQKALKSEEQEAVKPKKQKLQQKADQEKSESKPKKKQLQEKDDQEKTEVEPKEERQKFSYTNILKKLSTVTGEEEAVSLIKQDIEKGELGLKDIGNVIRKWRQAKQRKDLPRPDLKELFAYEGTLSDLKELVTGFVNNGLLHPMAAGRIVSKWKMREGRRVRRQIQKKNTRVCLRCRESGHKINECPKMTNQEGVDICFKCGSTEHAIYKCPRKDKVQGFPYATCFICKEQGHLSKDCDKNEKGIYPDGGCCNICFSKFHLIRDCPQRLSSSGATVGEDMEKAIRKPINRSVDEDNFEFETDKKDAEEVAEHQTFPKKSIKKGNMKKMPSLPRVDRIKTIYSARKALNYGFRFTDFVKQPAFNGVSRFIPQMHRITFRFCKQSEDSVGMRNFIESRLVSLAQEHPYLVIYAQPIRNTTPTIRAEYGNGRIVHLSSSGLPLEQIEKDVQLMISRSGLPVVKFEGRQTASVPSIQGEWTPFTWQPARMTNAELMDEEFSKHKSVKQTVSDFVLEHGRHFQK